MERISAMVNYRLRRTYVCLETMERELIEIGKTMDLFMERTTPRKEYICQVLLAIPMLMILHQWCLVAPYSNYRIVNFVLVLLWIFVSLNVIGAIHLNIRTRLRMYLILSVDITMAWITLVNYWTYQQDGYEMCQEVNVILWTDITNDYKIPVLLTIMVRSLYLWKRIAIVGNHGNAALQSSCISVALIATISLDMLCIINLFPTFMSELSYWLHMTVLMAAFSQELIMAQGFDIEISRTKISELRAMARNEEEDENKYMAKANALEQNVQLRIAGNYDFLSNILQGQRFMLDSLSASAVFYFCAALIAELVLSERSVYEVVNIEFVLSVVGGWCTSIVALAFFSALLTCITNVCIAFSFFFLTTEVHIEEMMNSNTGGIITAAILTRFSESNILNLAYMEKVNAVKIVVLFSFYIIMPLNLAVIENRVRNVVNAGMAQDTSFYLRFGIIIGMFVIVPTFTTYQISLNLDTDFLSLFFAAGNHSLVILLFFLIVECFLVFLKWHAIQYRNKLEDIIHYLRYTKAFMTVVAFIVEAYFRCVCPFFKAWWFYRFVNASLGVILIIFINCYFEWLRYKKRQGLLVLLNNLTDVNYENDEEEHDCPICFSELVHGKVLPCIHSFHAECLQHWFQIRQVCPVCNTNV